MEPSAPPLPLRAWNAFLERGPEYVWHKTMRRLLAGRPGLKRRFLYADPRRYWTLRGGEDYFREQEDQPSRTARSVWLTERLARYAPASVLEIGCGYGKQLGALRRLLPHARLVGVDFSPTQLARGREHLGGRSDVSLVLGSGAALPFPDAAFDLVFTSAVILHNRPEVAERIRQEVVRVSRRWTAHNEDTDVTYNRYGYDTAAWYADRGIRLCEVGPIPTADDPAITQFCVAEPWPV